MILIMQKAEEAAKWYYSFSFSLFITECIAESPRIYSWDECETKGV